MARAMIAMTIGTPLKTATVSATRNRIGT